MKRFFSILLASVCLAACVGNPPAWWNPGNRYGQTQTPADTGDQPQTPAEPQAPVAEDEMMDSLPDSSYEEESISPLPEEEDTPAAQPVEEPALDQTLPAPSVLE